MKRLFGYIIGLATMLVMFATVYIASSIYDTSNKVVIEPYFMRVGLNAADLSGIPQPLADVQSSRLRDWLIQKFVYEYLYIEPVMENITRRTGEVARGFYAPLAYMSTKEVFNKWKSDVVPKMSELAEDGVRRTVTVFGEILKPTDSDYYRVDYETKTWYKPNDMTEEPVTNHGTMYLKIHYTGELWPGYEDKVLEYLREGIDPAVAFVFKVQDVK